MASPKKLTPAQALSRIYSVARGVVTPEYLADKKKSKKNKGGSVKKTKARTRKK